MNDLNSLSDFSPRLRCEEIALYMLRNLSTVRDAAHAFGISKSTVHKDLTVILPMHNRLLAEDVKSLLDKNKAERHFRGGEATKRKYEAMRLLWGKHR